MKPFLCMYNDEIKHLYLLVYSIMLHVMLCTDHKKSTTCLMII